LPDRPRNTLATISLTATLGGSANNVAVFFWTDSTQAQNVTLDIGKAQLEVGSTATATALAVRAYPDELYLCRRYYQKTFPYATAPAQIAGLTGSLVNVSATTSPGSIAFRVYMAPAMLAAPTLITYNTNFADANWWDSNGNASRTVFTAEVTAESFRILMNATTTAGSQHFIHYTVESELRGSMPYIAFQSHLGAKPAQGDLLNRINVICPVQRHLQKYFRFLPSQISSLSRTVPSHRGALRNVINAGRDAVDAGGTLDESC
jgi:hypothetical protein